MSVKSGGKRRTPLVRSIAREIHDTRREEPKYQKMMGRSLKRARAASRQGASVGKITSKERGAIRAAAKATKLTTGSAQEAKKVLRRKARKS